MKRPLALFLACFVVLPAIFIFFGLPRVGWSWAALPSWYWGAALVFGLLCLTGSSLMTSAKPHLPFTTRMVRFGAGWGLPFTYWMLSSEVLQGALTTADLPLILLLALVAALIYGAIAAHAQQNKTV